MTKQQSKQLQGIAILMMIFLHLLAGYGNWNEKSIFLNDSVVTWIAQFCKICVSIYAFISGYGLTCKWKSKRSEIKDYKQKLRCVYKFVFGYFWRFMKTYWNALIIVVLLNIVFGKEFNILEFLKNVLAISSSYNYVWWYVRYYIIMLIVIWPITIFVFEFSSIINKYANIFTVCSWGIISILSYILYIRFNITGAFSIIVFLEGIYLSYFDYFEIILTKIKKRQIYILLCLASAFVLRGTYTNANGEMTWDYIVVFLLSLAYCSIKNNLVILKFFEKIGSESTYMWLLHPVFYMYSRQIVDKCIDGISAFIVVVVLSYCLAVVINAITIRLKKLRNMFIVKY